MRKHIPSGFWELFVPGLGEGTIYKYPRQHRRSGIREVRSLWLRRRAAAAHRLESGRSRPLPLARLGLDGQPAAGATRSMRRCRSTKSTWAVGAGRATIRNRWLTYRDLAHQLVDYCQRDGLHAHRTAAGQRASVFRKLGLSDRRLFRRHQPLRLAARLHVFRRPLPSERHRRDPRLGAGPFPARRPRPADRSTARASTSMPIRGKASIPTGAR